MLRYDTRNIKVARSRPDRTITMQCRWLLAAKVWLALAKFEPRHPFFTDFSSPAAQNYFGNGDLNRIDFVPRLLEIFSSVARIWIQGWMLRWNESFKIQIIAPTSLLLCCLGQQRPQNSNAKWTNMRSLKRLAREHMVRSIKQEIGSPGDW